MLVQHHPFPLPSSPELQKFPDYGYNSHISHPSAVQINLNVIPKSAEHISSPDAPARYPAFTIHRAKIEDASAIADLGATVFSTTFGFSIPTKDLNAYLAEAYTTEAIEEDIRCPEKHVIVACARRSNPTDMHSESSKASTALTEESNRPDSQSEEEILGFAQLTENTTEPCLSHLPPSNLVELQRLYVSTSAQGLGVGKGLARSIDSIAQSLKYKALWLGVWEGNFRAQRVYEGLGFQKVGDHEFKMGSCIQMDWIMCKDLCG